MPFVRAPRAVSVLVAASMLAAGCSRGEAPPQAQAPPPIPVTVASAVRKPVPVQLRAIGNVQPSNTVTVRARISGVLQEVRMREGQDVKAGQVLFVMDRRPLEAELRQAEANLAKSVAQLENARRDAARYAELVRRGFVAQQQYDQLLTNVAALEATVRADRAVVENARLLLGYTVIRAPLDGRAGALLVHEGDVITANNTPLVVINQLRPINAAFALPEQQLPEVQQYRERGAVAVQALNPVDGKPLDEGELTFVDNRVDPATGTIQLKATFPNERGTLWPGQFVNVVLTLTVDPDAIVVPSQAVQTGQQGRYVFVVRPDATVESRPVAVARELGEETVVTQGVAPGELVVTDGQLRLVPGAKVDVKTATATTAPPPVPAASPTTAR